MKRKISGYKTICIIILAVVFTFPCLAQTAGNGPVPAGLAGGSPLGSYGISGIENVSLYNGRVNVNVPLLKVGVPAFYRR